MDLMQLTDANYYWAMLSRHMILGFIAGCVYGGALGASIALKRWWVPSLLVLLPFVLAAVSTFLPISDSVTFRMFFLGASAAAVLGLTYWLSTR